MSYSMLTINSMQLSKYHVLDKCKTVQGQVLVSRWGFLQLEPEWTGLHRMVACWEKGHKRERDQKKILFHQILGCICVHREKNPNI